MATKLIVITEGALAFKSVSQERPCDLTWSWFKNKPWGLRGADRMPSVDDDVVEISYCLALMIINRAIRQMFGFYLRAGRDARETERRWKRMRGIGDVEKKKRGRESMTNARRIHLRQTIYRRYSDDRNGPRPLPHYAAAFNYCQLIHYTAFRRCTSD